MGADETHVSNIRRGTPLYMAPELVQDGRATKASDIYSFGVLLYELATGTTVARSLPMRKRVPCLPLEFFHLPAGTPAPYVKLVYACLQPVPTHRPSFQEAVAVLLQLLQQGWPGGRAAEVLAPAEEESIRQAHRGRQRRQVQEQQLQQQQLGGAADEAPDMLQGTVSMGLGLGLARGPNGDAAGGAAGGGGDDVGGDDDGDGGLDEEAVGLAMDLPNPPPPVATNLTLLRLHAESLSQVGPPPAGS